MKQEDEEFEKFDNTMRKLIAVPHGEIKAKLEAEKAAKAKNSDKGIADDPSTRRRQSSP